MRGRLGMNTESPMHIMHLPSSRAFNSRGYRQILWYAPSTMVLVRALGQYRTPRYFDVAHTEDHRVPYALVASCTEHHGIWTRATPWCPVEYRVCCGSGSDRGRWLTVVSQRRKGVNAYIFVRNHTSNARWRTVQGYADANVRSLDGYTCQGRPSLHPW